MKIKEAKKQRNKGTRKKERPNSKTFQIISASCFFASCFFYIFPQAYSYPSPPAENQVCFKDSCIDVEVVQKQEDRTRGLQFRKSLGGKNGMLFIFPNNRRQSFWMKDTFISIDIIWMDPARKVVHIEKNVPPCKADPCPTYVPNQNALYVLEINAGHAASLNIHVGDRAVFQLLDS
jgi:uncharacterized protein